MRNTLGNGVSRRSATMGLATVVGLGLTGVPAGPAGAAVAAPPRSGAGGPRRVTSVTVTAGTGGTHVVTWSGERVGSVEVFASTDPRDPARTGARVTMSADTSVVVPGLDPGQRWYFAVRPVHGGTAHGLVAANRQVALQGAINARDLGGYESADGRRVAWGRVYRADALGKLSGADLARLAALGLRTVVDFRGDKEIAKDGAARVPAGVTVVRRPLLDAATEAMAEAILRALETGDTAILEHYFGDGRGRRMQLDGHREMITSERYRQGFGDTLRRVADPAQTPLVFNCSAGKDRTGVMAAVVLLALGVPRETVMADYLLSNHYRRAANEATYAYLASKGLNAELLRPNMEQQPEYLEAAFEALDTRYGTIDAYLRTGLELTAAEVRSLRHNLLV